MTAKEQVEKVEKKVENVIKQAKAQKPKESFSEFATVSRH